MIRRVGGSFGRAGTGAALLLLAFGAFGPFTSSLAGQQRLRPPTLGLDPFRDVVAQRWGFAVVGGGLGENDALNASDIGAVTFLADRDSLRTWDLIDALTLVPRGQGFGGAVTSHAGIGVTVQLSSLTLGLSAVGRAYGDFGLDEQVVSLIREGNVETREVSLSGSGGMGLASSELGAHALVRVASGDGGMTPAILVGAGLRFLQPIGFARGATVGDGGRIAISGDSIIANLELEVLQTSFDDIADRITNGTGGSGRALDLMARVQWPRLAFELMVANQGSATVLDVERRTMRVDITVPSIDSLISVLDDGRTGLAGDTLAFVVRDTASHEMDLPRHVRLSASYELNRALQIHGSFTAVSGRYVRPRTTAVGATLRLIGSLPIRGGVVLTRNNVVGYTGGIGIETRHFVLNLQAASLGGFLESAQGLGAQLRMGLYF